MTSAYRAATRACRGRRRRSPRSSNPREVAGLGQAGASRRASRSHADNDLRHGRPASVSSIDDRALRAGDGRVGERERVACDLLRDVRGLDAEHPSVLAIAGRLRFDQRLNAFLPDARRSASDRPAPAAASFDLDAARRRRLGGRRSCGRDAIGGERRHARIRRRRCPSRRGRSSPLPLPPAPRTVTRLRRFPERRDRQGCAPRAARRLPLDRAHQALHHDRHGDRPGQDLEHQRARHRLGGARHARSPRSASPPSACPIRP